MFSKLKTMLATGVFAAGLTYLSLLVPGRVGAVCENFGTPVHCPVLAYGFPLAFLADGRTTSPVGSVARDPLSLLLGEDDVLWPRLALSAAFWLLAAVIGRRVMRRRRSDNA